MLHIAKSSVGGSSSGISAETTSWKVHHDQTNSSKGSLLNSGSVRDMKAIHFKVRGMAKSGF